jgi:hypothetical protein
MLAANSTAIHASHVLVVATRRASTVLTLLLDGGCSLPTHGPRQPEQPSALLGIANRGSYFWKRIFRIKPRAGAVAAHRKYLNVRPDRMGRLWPCLRSG